MAIPEVGVFGKPEWSAGLFSDRGARTAIKTTSKAPAISSHAHRKRFLASSGVPACPGVNSLMPIGQVIVFTKQTPQPAGFVYEKWNNLFHLHKRRNRTIQRVRDGAQEFAFLRTDEAVGSNGVSAGSEDELFQTWGGLG